MRERGRSSDNDADTDADGANSGLREGDARVANRSDGLTSGLRCQAGASTSEGETRRGRERRRREALLAGQRIVVVGFNERWAG